MNNIFIHIHPLPQHAHHGIFPLLFECDVIEIFRLDVDCWLIFPNDSRDEVILFPIDEPVDPPRVIPLFVGILLQKSPQYASTPK